MGCHFLPPSPSSSSACLVESLRGRLCFLPKVTDAETKINMAWILTWTSWLRPCSHHIYLIAFVLTRKPIKYSITAWSGTSHSHLYQTWCWCGWPRGFGALISCPHSRIFTFIPVCSSPCPYLVTSTTIRQGVYTAPKYGTKRIW